LKLFRETTNLLEKAVEIDMNDITGVEIEKDVLAMPIS
jgi:hypothetical protein